MGAQGTYLIWFLWLMCSVQTLSVGCIEADTSASLYQAYKSRTAQPIGQISTFSHRMLVRDFIPYARISRW